MHTRYNFRWWLSISLTRSAGPRAHLPSSSLLAPLQAAGHLFGAATRRKQRSAENYSDHPHPPYLQKNAPPKHAIRWGSVWHKSPLKSRDFYRKYGIWTPKKMAYKPPLLCHMNVFIGGGGGLQFVEVLANGTRQLLR